MRFIQWTSTIIAMLLSMSSAQAIYICINDEGKRIMRDFPCPKPLPTASHDPVKATAITDINGRETLRRFTEAINQKLNQLVEQFLDSSFSFERHISGQKSLIQNKEQYLATINKQQTSIKDFHIERNCGIEKSDSTETMLLSCSTRELGEDKGKPSEQRMQEFILLKIDQGMIKVSKIRTYIGMPILEPHD